MSVNPTLLLPLILHVRIMQIFSPRLVFSSKGARYKSKSETMGVFTWFLYVKCVSICQPVCLFARRPVTSIVATPVSAQLGWSLAYNNGIIFQLFTQLKSGNKCKKEGE